MAKTIKSKRISITTFDKVMRETSTPIKTIQWNGIDITIKHTISFKDVLTFVSNVTNSCFATDGSYLPEVKPFAIKCCVLEMYANFTLPANVEHKYDLVYNTDAFDTVIEHINIRQLNEIVDAISDKVDNVANANIEAINRQMSDIYTAFDGLQKQIGGIFNGLNSEDVLNFMTAVTESKLDEEKLVDAYIGTNKATDGKDGE